MGYAHEYATAVWRRGRVPMEPADFVPDWADRPRKGKYFPGAAAFALPDGEAGAAATVEAALHPAADPAAGASPGPGPSPAGGAAAGGGAGFTLPLLAAMLRDTYGLLGRRLGVQANSDLGSLPFYTHANWSRGTASGGGLYPVGIHWVCGPSGPLTPGVYYYATGHHTMQRLLAGDVSAEVAAALGDGFGGAGPGTDQFLVLSVKFWQNAFKYNSFCYHAVTMDIGALLQSWRMWARAQGLEIGPLLWFDEERLCRLLGVRCAEEGVFAVVPLRWQGGPRPPSGTVPASARVELADQERSRTVLAFETVERIHAATLAGAAARPDPLSLTAALPAPLPPGGERIELPPPVRLERGLRDALRARRSSFGRFSAALPLRPEELSAMLAAATAAGSLGSDAEPPGAGPLTRLYVFVNHVASLEPGAYCYDPADRSLRLVAAGPHGGFLQRAYFLTNYNLEQCGAVIVCAVRTHAVLDAVGDRGYRLVNAVVGATAQSVYTAATAAGLGCGVALGFDCVSYAEQLSLPGSGELPLLITMVGNEAPRPADFHYEIAPR